MRRRPMRSAWVVIHREMRVSPNRVRLNSRPMCVSAKPSSARYSAREMEMKP
jgi:hypothetical protein